MATTWKFFTDAAISNELTSSLVIDQKSDGSTGDVDGVLYLASASIGKVLQADSSPGVDPLVISVIDNNISPGNSPEVTDFKLALSNAGLDAAVAGVPLNIGATLISGTGGAIPIHYRQIKPTAITGVYNDISISTNAIFES